MDRKGKKLLVIPKDWSGRQADRARSGDRVYFDYAAATPVDPGVLKAMSPYFSGKFGNPGSLHSFGQEAITAVDNAREIIARAIGANHGQIIFTSSATEANNLAIKGAFFKARKFARFAKPKILVSAVEHESVHESARFLRDFGAEIIYIPVDKKGIVDLKKLKSELDSRVILVSVMLGNNEIGTIEPIAEISKIISEFKATTCHLPPTTYPLFHSDTAQAFPYLKINADVLGADMLTVSSQKIYGPKGAGALYVRALNTKSSKLQAIISPLVSGGGQEYGMRAGTENVPAIAGFGEAVKIAEKIKNKEIKRLAELKAYFWRRTQNAISNAEINGPQEGGLPHIINIYIPGRDAETLLARLDLAGFAVSSGSACSARAMKPSHVLLALGYSEKRAKESIRVSFGRDTKKADIDKLVEELKK